jgi:hypothetical protein
LQLNEVCSCHVSPILMMLINVSKKNQTISHVFIGRNRGVVTYGIKASPTLQNWTTMPFVVLNKMIELDR